MKKAITAVAATLIVGFFAVSAYAWGCGGYGGGKHSNGYYKQSGYNNGEHQAFVNETQDLRASIFADRTELNALMAGTNPDPQKARALAERISKSENELRSKAQQYHVAGGMGNRGYGREWNWGITGHNRAFSYCR